MLYRSVGYALAFNEYAPDIPEDVWRGTELESYFQPVVDSPPARSEQDQTDAPDGAAAGKS